MLRFTVLFCLFLAGLFALEVLQPVDEHVIVPFTTGIAKLCTTLISAFDHNAVSVGKVIRSTQNGFAVSIERGCNGVEAVIILFAAIFAFPAPIKHKLAGFAVGFVAIQGLNLVRIISLFYLGEWETVKALDLFYSDEWQAAACTPARDCPRIWFEWFHLYMW